MESKKEPFKRPQFGNRLLTDPKKVFEHNAWDNVEWDEEQEKNAKEKIDRNSQYLVPQVDQERYEKKANAFWDDFYGLHKNRFFKDRHWLFTEFPELCSESPVLRTEKQIGCVQTVTHNNVISKDEENMRVKKQIHDVTIHNVCCKDVIYPGCDSSTKIFEVGCGVGNSVFPILEANNDPGIFIYCCDFSEVAISLVKFLMNIFVGGAIKSSSIDSPVIIPTPDVNNVLHLVLKENPFFDLQRCNAFVCDITADNWDVPFPVSSLDFVILIFVLSAVHPDKMQHAVNVMTEYLKPGGCVLFRDYGQYDMAELRFKPGKCLAEHFYVRGDGTRVYFFSQEKVHQLFSNAGLVKEKNLVDRRLQVNRGRLQTMYRVWIQAKQVCMKFTKAGTTQTISALPFIAGLTCTSLWLHYGTNVKDFVLIVVNFVAVLLQSCYILWYYLYTKNKSVIHSQLLIIGSFLASAFTYSLYIAENQQVETNVIGLLACGGSLFACAAPLSSVKEVLRTKSTDSLPFLIIFASFIVTSLWFSYGMLVKDTFLQVPNFFGALLSGFQLCLFIIYPMKRLKKDS